MEAFAAALLANGDRITSLIVVGLVLGFFAWGVVTGKVHVGPEFARLQKRCDTLEAAAKIQTDELIDQKEAAAEARVRIEYLEAEVRRERAEREAIVVRLGTVEAELNKVRDTWQPPSRRRQAGREQP